jgi:hypothetical protein
LAKYFISLGAMLLILLSLFYTIYFKIDKLVTISKKIFLYVTNVALRKFWARVRV